MLFLRYPRAARSGVFWRVGIPARCCSADCPATRGAARGEGRSADMAQTATRPTTGSRSAAAAAGTEGGPDAAAAPLSGLLAAVLATEAVRGVVATAGTPSHRITAPAGARPFLASALAADT